MSVKGKRNTAKKPQTSRYTKVKAKLESSLFGLNKTLVDTTKIEVDQKIYNSVDLFCGCGGLSKGFEDAGFRSILGVEIDPDALQHTARTSKMQKYGPETYTIYQMKKLFG